MTLRGLVLLILVATVAEPLSAEDAVDIGSRRELFVDDLLIGKLHDAKLKLHQPQKLRRVPPRPFGHYATVLKDGERLRLYYRGDKVPGAHWPKRMGQIPRR